MLKICSSIIDYYILFSKLSLRQRMKKCKLKTTIPDSHLT